MEIVRLEDINILAGDLLPYVKGGGTESLRSADILLAAEEACREGRGLIEMRAVISLYDVDGVAHDSGLITLRLPECQTSENIYIGPKVEYLAPAEKAAVALATVGAPLTLAIDSHSKSGDSLTARLLGIFGIQALEKLSALARYEIEKSAANIRCGVGPAMQPGSVAGWPVSGQRDLFRLGRGDQIGLSIDDNGFLFPYISKSMLVGIGPNYATRRIGSLCHECPRRNECMWKRDNVME